MFLDLRIDIFLFFKFNLIDSKLYLTSWINNSPNYIYTFLTQFFNVFELIYFTDNEMVSFKICIMHSVLYGFKYLISLVTHSFRLVSFLWF